MERVRGSGDVGVVDAIDINVAGVECEESIRDEIPLIEASDNHGLS